MLQLMKVVFSLAVLTAPALAQGVPQTKTPPTTQAQKDQAPEKRANDRQQDRQSRPRESDRPTIGPQTTQGLAQDAITRSNSR
jgi:hypothetical protein